MIDRNCSERSAIADGAISEEHSSAANGKREIIAQELARDGVSFRTGNEMRSILGTEILNAWSAFAASWDDLGMDSYMADGGRYRRRRFAVFTAKDGFVQRATHQPHYQSRDYNPVNGGLERWFLPMETATVENHFARRLLGCCTMLFDLYAGQEDLSSRWHIEMHQFRIEATATETGSPTPEGAHRDGVDFVSVMLIDRINVSSGVTQIYDPSGKPLGEFTLTNPLDTVFLDDRRVFHGVTPIRPLDPTMKTFRDVLVLTYRRICN